MRQSRRSRAITGPLLALACMIPSKACPQQEVNRDGPPGLDARHQRFNQILHAGRDTTGAHTGSLNLERPDGDPTGVPEVGAVALGDSATRTSYLATVRAYLAYRSEGYRHRQRVFDWQHASTILIFVAVLLLVCSGIFFAGVQFFGYGVAGRRDRANPQGKADASTVKLSPHSVEVSSPILGVVILALSLAFFYCYLVYVYPIHEVF